MLDVEAWPETLPNLAGFEVDLVPQHTRAGCLEVIRGWIGHRCLLVTLERTVVKEPHLWNVSRGLIMVEH